MFLNDFPMPEPVSAMRMVFECENQQMRLVAQIPVDMPAIASDISQTPEAGYYVDARDLSGKTLARVPAHDVFPTSVEVFPENSDEFITRHDKPACNSAFTVVIPLQNETDHITVVQVSPIEGSDLTPHSNRSEHQKMKSTELASFKLLDVR